MRDPTRGGPVLYIILHLHGIQCSEPRLTLIIQSNSNITEESFAMLREAEITTYAVALMVAEEVAYAALSEVRAAIASLHSRHDTGVGKDDCLFVVENSALQVTQHILSFAVIVGEMAKGLGNLAVGTVRVVRPTGIAVELDEARQTLLN